jgi:hypothetical protein
MSQRRRHRLICLVALLAAGLSHAAEDDGYVLFLDEYLHGDFYVAALGDVDARGVHYIRPRRLRMPWPFGTAYEIGNADVSIDGRTIVFAARHEDELDWDIYAGTLDLSRNRVLDVEKIIGESGTREEDPRFSWDGGQIVYKCDGNICVYPGDFGNPAVASSCELWAPAFDPSGYTISYGARCGDAASDRLRQTELLTGKTVEIPNAGGGADRFAQFANDGRLVYSHIDSTTGTSSLWTYDSGFSQPLLDRTYSDDDPYPDKRDSNHIAFIGWQDDGYDLFIYRADRNDAVQLTRGISVLGPVLFRR